MSQQFYITTPLYYVNDEPHIGHAYTTVLADVLSRFYTHLGYDVHFLTGLDEHGQKVAAAASKLGRTPQEHCDKMAIRFLDVWKKLGIEYSDFMRTTEPRHEKIVVEILQTLYDKGDIYEEEYEGWYSVFEERFFTEKDLIDGKDPIGGRAVEKLKETNFFFRMSKYQDWLIEHYRNHPDAVVPDFRLNEVLGFLRQPLGDLCISRPKSRLTWGIPIPWNNDYVTYVWFDALINYYSATLTPPPDSKVNWPADYHLIGKDILTTHAVYWPIMLHAAGIEPPKRILAHGYWLTQGDIKMSKSIGNVVPPLKLSEIYGVDAFRYVLLREMVLGQDAHFSEDIFIKRYNSDLANDLGNLFSRLSKVWNTGNYGRVLPPANKPENIPDDLNLLRTGLSTKIQEEIISLRLHVAIEETMQLIRGLNRFIEHLQPWKLVKTDPAAIKDSLAWALDSVYEVAQVLEPVMPGKMNELRNWIKPSGDFIEPQPDKILFPRLKPTESKLSDSSNLSEEKSVSNAIGSFKPEISIEDFSRIDLRIGTIVEANKLPDSKKLLVIKVDLGSEQRQVVAGIAEKYQPDKIIGRQVVVVANLRPVKLRGQLSEGMILAIGDKEIAGLVSPDSFIQPGTIVR